MADAKTPTSARPFQSAKITGAAAGKLRLITLPREIEAVAIRVMDSGSPIAFRVEGEGADDDDESGDGWPTVGSEAFVYTRDLGQQNRTGPALAEWAVLVACDVSAADIFVTSSYHRNN